MSHQNQWHPFKSAGEVVYKIGKQKAPEKSIHYQLYLQAVALEKGVERYFVKSEAPVFHNKNLLALLKDPTPSSVEELKDLIDEALKDTKNWDNEAVLYFIKTNPFTPKEVMLYLLEKDFWSLRNQIKKGVFTSDELMNHLNSNFKDEDLNDWVMAVNDREEISEELALFFLEKYDKTPDGVFVPENQNYFEDIFFKDSSRSNEFLEKIKEKYGDKLPQRFFLQENISPELLRATASDRNARGHYQALRNPNVPLEILEERLEKTVWPEEKKQYRELIKNKKRNDDFDKKKGGGITNLLNKVFISKKPKERSLALRRAVEDCDKVLEAMNLKLNKSVDFYCDDLRGQRTGGTYTPSTHSITLKTDGSVQKTLLHEIGHALDYDFGRQFGNNEGLAYNPNFMSEVKNEKLKQIYADAFVKQKELNEAVYNLRKVAQETDFYTKNRSDSHKLSDGRTYSEYIQKPTEIFARAFEVYSYQVARTMEDQGKVASGFCERFHPDIEIRSDNPEVRQKAEVVATAMKDVIEKMNAFRNVKI